MVETLFLLSRAACKLQGMGRLESGEICSQPINSVVRAARGARPGQTDCGISVFSP